MLRPAADWPLACGPYTIRFLDDYDVHDDGDQRVFIANDINRVGVQ